jgi:hypothetical protein
MADIDAVPKGRPHIWAWIALALVIVALLVLFVVAGRAEASTSMQQPFPALPLLSSALEETLFLV